MQDKTSQAARFLKTASNGNTLCHFWRDGSEYYRQKSPVFLKEFTNVRFSVYPQPPEFPYLRHDLSTPLPFSDACFDHINSYHIFEHLSPEEADAHAKELFRILKPGGILRVSTPDLERISREYLEYLEKSLQDPGKSNLQRYQWCVYELIDQATRTQSGGMMYQAIASGDYDKEYLMDRYSDVFDPFLNNHSGKEQAAETTNQPAQPASKGLARRLLSLTPGKLVNRWRWIQYRRAVARLDREMEGDLRLIRESVRWMHDRLSLRLLVEDAGFHQVKDMDFKSSDIPDWDSYDLDCSNYAERAIDPSVYIECRKPE